MHDENCIFCKIVSGEIPSHKVYEDKDVYAFLDASPLTAGHTLVITKDHYENFMSVPQEKLHNVMDVVQKIGQAQIRGLLARGVNIISNAGTIAGQAIMHFHIHVIPRYEVGDGFRITEFNTDDAINFNLPVLAGKISDELK